LSNKGETSVVLVVFLWRHHLYWYRLCDVPTYTGTVSVTSPLILVPFLWRPLLYCYRF